MQAIYDIAEICSQHDIENVILCPGSRCAPLTLAFARHSYMKVRVFSDERSAAFVALGIAQATKQTVVLICTSGSAVYNFAPAIAEAYFAEVPLLVLSADRPTEWIAQQDGQTIYQQHIFGKHVKGFFQLPQEYEHADNQWSIHKQINEAINLSKTNQPGPVHINIPLREPLYPKPDQKITFSNNSKVVKAGAIDKQISEATKTTFIKHWKQYNKVLIVSGQHDSSSALSQLLRFISEKHDTPILGDILSNLHGLENTIRLADSFLGASHDSLKESLQPEMLITFGKSIISKQVKLFLRKYKAIVHWHISESNSIIDTYQSLTNYVNVSPETFFTFVSSLDKKEQFDKQKKENYAQLWKVEEKKAKDLTVSFFPQATLGEMEVVEKVLNQLPQNTALHLANSMSVRYANYIGLKSTQAHVEVFSNRGTSGIDGCTSTVVGHCLAKPDTTHLLITGDIAFFYDRNAFWHQYKLPNLRILLLNNHGGVIFKLIDGPADLPESDVYFATQQALYAKHLCAEFGIEHLLLDNRKKLTNHITNFLEAETTTKILEVETDTQTNKTIFENFKKKLNERYES